MDNPFHSIEISRVLVEDAKPILVLTPEIERRFLEACDEWQFPIFATILMTGLRPRELAYLLLPGDLDLERGWLYVCNKPAPGWCVKTRNERDIPLVPPLVAVLRLTIGNRRTGPMFRQRRCAEEHIPLLEGRTPHLLEREVQRHLQPSEMEDRQTMRTVTRTIWHDLRGIERRLDSQGIQGSNRNHRCCGVNCSQDIEKTLLVAEHSSNMNTL